MSFLFNNVTFNHTAFNQTFNNTFDDDFLSSTAFDISSTEFYTTLNVTRASDPGIQVTIFGNTIDLTGLEFMILYMVINVIMLILIVIFACRSGARKTREERERLLKRQKQREEQKMLAFALAAQNERRASGADEVEEVADDSRMEVQLAVRNNNNHHNNNELQLAPSIAPSSHHSAGDDEKTVHSELTQQQQQLQLHSAEKSEAELSTVSVYCGACIGDMMNRGPIYSAFLVHIWDQGSDLGVIWTWFTDDRWRYLGWISIGVLIQYRLFSAYSLRKAQRGWRDTLLQVLDLQLLVDVYRSFEDVKATDGLYWIRAMEAVLESSLQILLQFVFLYQATDAVVWLSLFGSMGSVIFSLLHYTDVIFTDEQSEEEVEQASCCERIWLKIRWYVGYVLRFLFRLCEVTSRCMVLALVWSTWNNEDHTNLRGALIVGFILGIELVFYSLLTQFRIPPWEVTAFLIVNIDLTLTFEGRAGALSRPLENNVFYKCICKPVAEMFTKISDDTERYYQEHTTHARDQSNVHHRKKINVAASQQNAENNKNTDPQRQKLLIAPSHYVYRFLESVFEIFCVVTYAVVDDDIFARIFETNQWIIILATVTTVLTPILYCSVRAFADETKTLERNLIALVHHADTKEIIKLIGAGASLRQKDYEGNNIVHACIAYNNVELLRRILRRYKKDKNSVDINVPNKKGFTPLLLAAKYGATECMRFLAEQVDEHADMELDFADRHIHTGKTLLHIAAEYDHPDTLAFLMTLHHSKTEINATYIHRTDDGTAVGGYNACHAAARNNAFSAMDVLLANAVDFRRKLSNRDTCAIVAASRGHTIILLKLFEAGDDMNVRGAFGHTPLYRAALNNHPGTVLVLGRDFGADPNIVDENGEHIVTQCFRSCNFACLQRLADLGCRFDNEHVRKYDLIETEIHNKHDLKNDKLTALMFACKYNQPRLVKTLLDSGASPNHRNRLDETAAHHAAAMGNLECLKILFAHRANLSLGNGLNQTPRDKAIQQRHRYIVEWLDEMHVRD